MRQESTFLGRPVYSLQTMLRFLSNHNPAIPPVVPDGIYGEDTLRAVTAAQRELKLPATGIVDLLTWEAITVAFTDALQRQMPPEPLQIILEPDQQIQAGEHNDHLHLVQAMFHVLSTHYANAPDMASTGVLDDATVTGVLWLQELSALPPTGEVGRAEWRNLIGLYRMSAGSGTQEAPAEQRTSRADAQQ